MDSILKHTLELHGKSILPLTPAKKKKKKDKCSIEKRLIDAAVESLSPMLTVRSGNMSSGHIFQPKSKPQF